jgi:hypothetical protein
MMRWQIDVWEERSGTFSRKKTRCVVCRAEVVEIPVR